MLTKEQARDIEDRIQAFEAWRNGRTCIRNEEIPSSIPRVTNEERSALEVYRWMTNPPERYFLYIDKDEATTWTGDKLGQVRFGREYQTSGHLRQVIEVYGTNGRTYTGTFYKSAGNYARVHARKAGSR